MREVHVSATEAWRPRSSAGFSLLEAVIAAGLLLMTIATMTACLANAGAGRAHLKAAMDGDRAVCAVAERLRGLPFCAAAYPDPGSARGPVATDLVAAVFPHARVSENTDAARYVAAGMEADVPSGSFVTLLEDQGVEMRCVARFLEAEGGVALGGAELDGWSVGEWDAPPGSVLEVHLTAVSHGVARTVCVLRSALAAPGIDHLQRPASVVRS
jgi:hypothetical protein